MTHSEIVKIASKWLKKHDQNILVPNCPIVATELHTANKTGEIPDVIGFASNTSVLIEVKTSYDDFYAERYKPFRFLGRDGMGNFRYFCCPTGVIPLKSVWDSWGLHVVDIVERRTLGKRNTEILIMNYKPKEQEQELFIG